MIQSHSLRLALLIVLAALGITYRANAQQLHATLNVSAHPDPYLSHWASQQQTAMLTVTNTGSSSVQGKFKVEINKDNSLVARTKFAQMQIVTFPAGVSMWNAGQMIPFSNVDFFGPSKNTAIQTGQLPAGNYTFCVDVENPSNGQSFIGGQICKPFSLTAYQVPTLIQPLDKTVLASQDRPTLRWTPVSPQPPYVVQYEVDVFEVLKGQQSMQAFAGNQPVLNKKVSGMTQLLWPFDVELPGRVPQYIWTVRALDNQGNPVGDPNGYAQPFTFTVGQNIAKMKKSQSGDTSGHNKSSTTPTDSTAVAGGTGAAAVGDTIKAGLNGEFKVIVSQMTTETDGSLTGQGKVRIKWLGVDVAVEFKTIRIDTTRKLTKGYIVTSQSGIINPSDTTYPQAWGMAWLSGPWVANKADGLMNWTNNKITSLASWVDNNVNLGQPKINYNDTIPPPAIPNNALKMPFGLLFHTVEGAQQLVITEMIFKPNESKINFLAQVNYTTNSGTPYTLGLAGKYFKIHPASIEFANGRVELAEDITIPDPKIEFTFKKGTDTSGCYVQWADSGRGGVGLGIEASFTRDWLLPIPSATATSRAKVTISGNGTSMHDIILTGNLPKCEIVGTNGLKIDSSQISLDFSDIRNPAGMFFPKNYTDDTTAQAKLLWQGFYMKNFSITLPETWKTGVNPTHITASDIIIDNQGLTMKMKATNVFTFQTVKVADLSASLDTIEVSILKGSLTSGSVKGKLVLPISKDTITNTLRYTATFAQVSTSHSLQIVIVPSGPIDASVLKGTMTLLPTSNITAVQTPDSLKLSAALNGSFKWDNPLLNGDTTTATGGTPVRKKGINGIKIELDFENVGLTYTHYPGTTPYSLAFNLGSWSFASPQKRLANFPVTIKKIYYKSLTTVDPPGGKELLRGALMIDIVANLTEDIGGSTSVGAAFAVEFYTGPIKFKPKFKGVFIDSIAVHADQPAVKINGYLKMYDNDPVYGDGFKAKLSVTFTAVSLQVDALVEFGNTIYLSNQFYRYWRVEADVKLPVGIPFLTGVGFYGFGGGAYWNMKAILKTGTTNVLNAYTFVPTKGFKGIKVSATIGTLPKVETFNADVSLTAQFNSSNGLDLITFSGDFWLATKLTERNNAKIYGGVTIDYTFPTKVFNLAGALTINVPPAISTLPAHPLGVALHIDGHTNKWYFKCGIPTNPNTVTVFGLSLYSYLMFGNDLAPDVPNGFTSRFRTNYSNATGSYPDNNNVQSGGVGVNTTTGKGIATGVGIEFEKDFGFYVATGLLNCKRSWVFGGKISAGAELNLAYLEYSSCGSYNPFGINGYRASGYLGLYGSVEVGIKGTPTQHTGSPWNCGVENHDLLWISGGAWCEGKFPNPEYVAGALKVDIEALAGLIKLHYYEYFEKGNNCSGAAVVDSNAPQEDKALDLKNKLIQYIAPAAHYNFPVASTINVKYALVPDQVFDVAENQGDGTIKNRTFKMVITKSLEVQNANGTWTLKTLQSKANNIGEYQYFIQAPSSIVVAGQASLGQLTTQTIMVTANQVNSNNGNILMAPNGTFKNTSIVSPVPPPPPPNYPNPVPTPVNNLVADKDYRFVVTADLQEGITSNNTITWSTAITRTNLPVKETKTKLFRTGNSPLITGTGSAVTLPSTTVPQGQ